MRYDTLRSACADLVVNGAVVSCQPQRAERSSAPVPKSAWRWIEAVQHRLVRHGLHRAMSIADLLIGATAAHHGLVVLHDDKDFEVAGRHLTDLIERNVHDRPA